MKDLFFILNDASKNDFSIASATVYSYVQFIFHSIVKVFATSKTFMPFQIINGALQSYFPEIAVFVTTCGNSFSESTRCQSFHFLYQPPGYFHAGTFS